MAVSAVRAGAPVNPRGWEPPMAHVRSMTCPRCRTMLAPEGRDQIVIDVCGRCGGMWLDAGELDRLPREGSPSSDQRDAKSRTRLDVVA